MEDELLAWAKALTANPSLGCVLLDDIVLKKNWKADGSTYSGTFDGKGYTIRNVVIESGSGFFDEIGAEASIKNLTLEMEFAGLDADEAGVGAFAFRNYGTISNCHSIISGEVSVDNQLEESLDITKEKAGLKAAAQSYEERYRKVI